MIGVVGGSAMKAPAYRSPPNGDSSASVHNKTFLQVVRRMVEQALHVLSSGEAWPPKAITESEIRPWSGSSFLGVWYGCHRTQ